MSNTPQTPEKQADHSIDTATGQEAPAEISSARVKKIFTDIAWKYERFNKLSSFGQYRSWLRTLIDKSPITSETLMLDIAGGTGDVTFTACERKQPKHIILSDYTPAMLEVAQSRLDAGEANGVPVELAVVDGQDIPYEDRSFDIITMSYGIRNMPERERALSEMLSRAEARRRAVRVGILDPAQSSYALGLQPVFALGYSHLGKDRHRRCFGLCVPGEVRSRHFPIKRACTAHAEECGLSRVEYTNVTFGVAAVHIAYKE